VRSDLNGSTRRLADKPGRNGQPIQAKSKYLPIDAVLRDVGEYLILMTGIFFSLHTQRNKCRLFWSLLLVSESARPSGLGPVILSLTWSVSAIMPVPSCRLTRTRKWQGQSPRYCHGLSRPGAMVRAWREPTGLAKPRPAQPCKTPDSDSLKFKFVSELNHKIGSRCEAATATRTHLTRARRIRVRWRAAWPSCSESTGPGHAGPGRVR
jgi:hypothetical protein